MSWADIERNGNDNEKVPYTKFNGTTRIRILDDEPYSFWQHWLPQQSTSVSCMGKECPICSVNAQAKANKEKPIYGNSQRHAMRIWNYGENRMEVMIQGKGFFSQLLTLNREIGDLKGYDIKVIRNGSGTDTTYTMLPGAPASFEYMDECKEVDMAELFKAPEKEVVLQLMEGKSWSDIYGTEQAA